LVEIIPPTLTLLDSVRPLAPRAVPTRRIVERCRDRLAAASAACARGRRPPAIGCAAAFIRAARELAVHASAPGRPQAPFDAASQFASRVGLLLRSVGRRRQSACGTASGDPLTFVPAVVALAEGGTALRIEPARPLEAEATYRIVANVPADVVGTLPALAPDGRLRGPGPSLADPLVPEAMRTFFAKVYAAAERARGGTVRPSLLLRLSRAIELGAIRPGSVGFLRETRTPSGEPGDAATGMHLRLRTGGDQLLREARRARAAGRKSAKAGGLAFVPAGSPGSVALGIPPGSLPSARGFLVGRFLSPDADSGRATRVPLLVALPRATGEPRDEGVPTVLLVHGHAHNATAFLLRHGEGLLARGLAAAAFDLPGHGARGEVAPFLDPLAPAAVARNVRQATLDTIAAATALSSVRDPSGARPRVAAAPVRLLGFSLGGMVVALALGAEPNLGPAVLVAPAGDLYDMLSFRVVLTLDIPPRRCAGGLVDGEVCPPGGGACPGGGTCAPNPLVLEFVHLAMPYRTLLADADPQSLAARAAGPQRTRPILIQEGSEDNVIENANTAWLASALGADMTCNLRARAPQTLCHFRGSGHDVIDLEGARAQAGHFLATDGRELIGADGTTSGTDALAAR